MTANRAKDIIAVLDEKILGQEMDDYPRSVEISLHLVGSIRELIRAYINLISKAPEKGQPKVSREWVNRRINEAKSLGMTDTDAEYFVFALLKESGVEVEE